jgi:hypothetical protein
VCFAVPLLVRFVPELLACVPVCDPVADLVVVGVFEMGDAKRGP